MNISSLSSIKDYDLLNFNRPVMGQHITSIGLLSLPESLWAAVHFSGWIHNDHYLLSYVHSLIKRACSCSISRGTSRSPPEIVDGILSDRRSDLLWVLNIWDWLSSSLGSDPVVDFSDRSLESLIFSSESGYLRQGGGVNSPEVSDLPLDLTSLIYPVISLLDFCDKIFIVWVDSSQSSFKLTDILALFVYFQLFSWFPVELFLALWLAVLFNKRWS